MKKSKLTLGVVTALIAIPAIAACGEVTAKEGVVLTYTDAAGKSHEYTAKDIFGSYLTGTSAASTAFSKVQELLIRQYFESHSEQLPTLKQEALNKVNSIKETASKNAESNGTTYQEEFEKLLSSEGVDNVDELLDKKLFEVEKDYYDKKYFTQEELNRVRDGEKWAALATDDLIETYGPITKGYLQDKMPYHVSHILVKFASAGANEHTQATISEAESRKLSDVVKEIAGVENTSVTGLGVSAQRLTFGSIAQVFSEDTGSAANYGDLGIMDKDTGFVPEFKLGVYAFDALYNQEPNDYAGANIDDMDGDTTTPRDLLLPSDDAELIDGSPVKDAFVNRGIGSIPYGAFVAMGAGAIARDPDLGYQVNNNDNHFYPRNVLFNKYFNNHQIAVITPNSIDTNAYISADGLTLNPGAADYAAYKATEVGTDGQAITAGTLNADYAALPGFSVDTTAILPGFANNVLTNDKGQIVLAVRAGASGSYEGMHFIVVDRSALSEFGTEYDETTHKVSQISKANYEAGKKNSDVTSLSEYYTMLTPGKLPSADNIASHNEAQYYPYYEEGGKPVAKTTFVNTLVSSTNSAYESQASSVTSKVRDNWSDVLDFYKFEELINAGNITFNDEGLGKLITSYIATRRVKSFNDFVEKFDEDWTNYAEYLAQQDSARKMNDNGTQRLISETCAINYGSNSAKTGAGDWAKGGACSNGK